MQIDEVNNNPTIEQLSAVHMALNNSISILTGGPGCGKTFTTKLILKKAFEQNFSVLQAAPTGKAAKRMLETTGYRASTIHSMLGCIFENGEMQFACNENNKLIVDLLIIDEVSMITLDLMADVFRAIDTNKTKILLVGDQDQLPSVGPGAVLRDLLDSKIVPHIELTKIFRNCGEIVRVCHQVKKGKIYTPATKFDLAADDPINLIHVEQSTPTKTKQVVVKLVSEIMPKKGFDPINDIQVISPVNKSGELSCESLNKILRETLNPIPPGLIFDDDNNIWTYKFRKGDRIINTKNTKVTTTDNKESNIVNGDLGIVDYVGNKEITVCFQNPERWVSISKSNQNLLHAYCITCHKFQGSEAPVIIIPVHRQFDMFLSNSWIYTALSRGKQAVITVGRWGTIERAIKNKKPNNRFTRLKEAIIDADNLMYDI